MKKNYIDVIVIDDSVSDILITEQVLKKHDRIRQVSSYLEPQEALDHLVLLIETNQKLPDLILLDIMMPEIDGYEFIDELDEHIPDDFECTLCILSSSDLVRHVEDFNKQRMATEMLSKPFSKASLEQILDKYFSSTTALPPTESTKQKRVKF